MIHISRDGWRRKRSLSQNRGSVSNTDAGTPPSGGTADLPAPSQSKSSLKGHLGSRPLRERTKERRVRVKGSNQRSARRENAEISAQDSESAYHTHEASDSVVDRTSSVEQDSNGRAEKGKNSVEAKLDISPRVTVHGCESVNGTDQPYYKTRESQESDLPQESNSEDDKKLTVKTGGVENSKRSSQSISSEDDENNEPKILPSSLKNKTLLEEKLDNISLNKRDLEKKIRFEGFSMNDNIVKVVEEEETVTTVTTEQSSVESKPRETNQEDTDSSFINISLENPPQKNGVCDVKIVTDGNTTTVESSSTLTENSSSVLNDQSACQSTQSEKTNSNQKLTFDLKCPLNSTTTVHFNKDPVQLREITPLTSRESTPTHTQSDSLLQSKRKVRGSSMCEKSDTDTESEPERSANKIITNVRRRKVVTLQESASCDNGSFGLRNRKQTAFALRDNQTPGTTAGSSSDGETEGHSSEYSRGSRRVGINNTELLKC